MGPQAVEMLSVFKSTAMSQQVEVVLSAPDFVSIQNYSLVGKKDLFDTIRQTFQADVRVTLPHCRPSYTLISSVLLSLFLLLRKGNWDILNR